jgi:hypothetical protein
MRGTEQGRPATQLSGVAPATQCSAQGNSHYMKAVGQLVSTDQLGSRCSRNGKGLGYWMVRVQPFHSYRPIG